MFVPRPVRSKLQAVPVTGVTYPAIRPDLLLLTGTILLPCSRLLLAHTSNDGRQQA